MYFVYAACVIALIVTVTFAMFEGFDGLMAGLIGSAVFGMVFVLVGNGLGALWTDTIKVNRGSTYITSVADGQETHGRFFLGSGYIDSEPAYFFYYTTGENRYKQGYVTGDVTIVEDSNVAPHIEYFESVSSNKNWCFLRGDKYNDYRIIYVPKGTVIQNYTLDTSAR